MGATQLDHNRPCTHMLQVLASLHATSTSCPTHQHSWSDLLQVLVTLKAIGFQDDDFDAIVTGNDVTHNKPDPSIFLTAASRVGVDPGSCVVLEDARAGMQAAQAAGEISLGSTVLWQ